MLNLEEVKIITYRDKEGKWFKKMGILKDYGDIVEIRGIKGKWFVRIKKEDIIAIHELGDVDCLISPLFLKTWSKFFGYPVLRKLLELRFFQDLKKLGFIQMLLVEVWQKGYFSHRVESWAKKFKVDEKTIRNWLDFLEVGKVICKTADKSYIFNPVPVWDWKALQTGLRKIIKPKGKVKSFRKEKIKLLAKTTDMGVRRIAKVVGCSKTYVQQVLKEEGIRREKTSN